MSILCKIFGHKWASTKFLDWLDDKTNFHCLRCGKQIRHIGGTLWRNRNKEDQ